MARVSPARLAAFRVLLAVEAGRADLPDALARQRASLEDERDRALTADISAGTLRWRGALDHLIAHFAGRPTSRLDAEVLEILRLSIYQLLHLDRVPAAAVVDEAVELTRRAGKASAGGFVNAVLRGVARNRHRLPLPPAPPSLADAAGDEARREGVREGLLEYLSTALSHPRWLVERWVKRHGAATAEAWARFNNLPAPLTLRANRIQMTRDELAAQLRAQGVETRPAEHAPDGLIVTDGNPFHTGLAGTGAFAVQDESSQLVALMTGAAAGERVLDACAAPGGKTTAMAAAMENRGLIVAGERRWRRVGLLQSTVIRSGATLVRVTQLDLLLPLPFRTAFDCVLVDAPCSGLGTVRRDPEIRWRRTEEDLPRLAGSQVVMLERAAEVVRPGGRLVYATCSSEPEENEQVVARFRERRPEFELDESEPRSPALRPLLDAQGFLQTSPHRHGLEPFFAARLVRRR